ncbi:Pycsar system effector family protein [Rhizorhabdus phycosphaerae]|uniref:Pycsar system effector family protein n=1 Tax=Rhizorhabdus phycosphaerae TaxID=2711156 RepID=UPI001D027BA4|nr:Pycsar system effector family protein [Rhizorhabdus phycosphaerae]
MMAADETRAPPRGQFAPDAVHLLRTAQQIQYQLSQMADQKANMLMGATFVIFTITVGQIKAGGHAPVALMILGAAAFLSALLAVMAVLPSTKVPPRADGPANMLFFGSFTQIEEEEFVKFVLDTVTDSDAVYAAFAHDIYQNGRVLARKKYRLLGYAYRVMLGGLILSFLAFMAQLVIDFG